MEGRKGSPLADVVDATNCQACTVSPACGAVWRGWHSLPGRTCRVAVLPHPSERETQQLLGLPCQGVMVKCASQKVAKSTDTRSQYTQPPNTALTQLHCVPNSEGDTFAHIRMGTTPEAAHAHKHTQHLPNNYCTLHITQCSQSREHTFGWAESGVVSGDICRWYSNTALTWLQCADHNGTGNCKATAHTLHSQEHTSKNGPVQENTMQRSVSAHMLVQISDSAVRVYPWVVMSGSMHDCVNCNEYWLHVSWSKRWAIIHLKEGTFFPSSHPSPQQYTLLSRPGVFVIGQMGAVGRVHTQYIFSGGHWRTLLKWGTYSSEIQSHWLEQQPNTKLKGGEWMILRTCVDELFAPTFQYWHYGRTPQTLLPWQRIHPPPNPTLHTPTSQLVTASHSSLWTYSPPNSVTTSYIHILLLPPTLLLCIHPPSPHSRACLPTPSTSACGGHSPAPPWPGHCWRCGRGREAADSRWLPSLYSLWGLMFVVFMEQQPFTKASSVKI